jgi:hypothetical protein
MTGKHGGWLVKEQSCQNGILLHRISSRMLEMFSQLYIASSTSVTVACHESFEHCVSHPCKM